jgi:hypothetical protein
VYCKRINTRSVIARIRLPFANPPTPPPQEPPALLFFTYRTRLANTLRVEISLFRRIYPRRVNCCRQSTFTYVVIRFSDPKSAFSIQNSIQLFDIRPRCRAAIRSCSRRSSHNETSRLKTKCRLASPSLPVRRFDLCKYRRSMRVRRRRARDRLTCAASLFTVLRVYS